MAEKSPSASDWRITLPEPARTYAESKLQQGRGIEYLAPQVLDFYHGNFCDGVIKLFESGDNKKGQQQLLQEDSNLILFLEWGYENETSPDKICRCARVTASLSPYWRWVEPNQDPLVRLNSALKATQRNHDELGEDIVRSAIVDFSSRGDFKDIKSLAEETAELQLFEFETVTVNRRGEEINRETKQAQYFIENLGKDTTLEMIAIPPGTFMMGSSEGEVRKNEKPQHEVSIQSFFMSKYQITQAQWKAVVALNKVNRELKPEPSYFKSDNLPVEKVSWYDAVEFCARLSNHTQREYRLPSEAEWEYACRARTTTPFHCGETITGELANYNAKRILADESQGEYREKTTPVGQFLPNAFGLYDMHGNVWGWCLDRWHWDYKNAPKDGSAWVKSNDNDNRPRVLRGGSWLNLPFDCRSTSRVGSSPDVAFNDLGFRVVCGVAPRTIE